MTGRDSFPRQYARTRRFTAGGPRDVKVAADGTRVAFLRSGGGSDPVNRLWVYDVASGTEREVADPARLLDGGMADVPAAERARRERAREIGAGIVAFDADRSLRRAVFALAGRLFLTDLVDATTTELPGAGGAFDPRLDPSGRRVAYVAGTALRVTGDGGDRLVIGEERPTVSWGSAEFVAAEEMHRTRGHWWSPQGDALAVARVDVAPVAEWYVASPVEPWQPPAVLRYPAAGTANATVELAVVHLDRTRVDVDWLQGEFEYLCDVQWTDGLTIVAQTRDQRTLAVLVADPHSGEVREVRRLIDDVWTDLVPGAPAWAGGRLLTVEVCSDSYSLCRDGEPITPPGVQVRRIVSTDGGVATFIANTDPSEQHVGRVRLDPPHDIEWLTVEPGVNSAAVGGATVVVQSTSLARHGSVSEVRVDGVVRGALRSLAETPVVEPRVELVVCGADALPAALVLPDGYAGDHPLPVLLDPYGGPGHARVVQSRGAYLTSQWLANQGFAVVVIDGRGTPGRGPVWDRRVRGDFSSVLDDQVSGLDALTTRYPFLDRTRVGIRGWSFGGYLAALAVLRRPDVFHAAVAGAPVTSWSLYDTHYTERYLGDPAREPENYERSDLLALAPALVRPLLLIHGMADDNVVVAHTLALSRSLLEAGRLHRVLPLSGVTHMTPQEVVAENLLELEVAFFRESLGISRA